jgi:hypothetical protein
MCGRIEVAVIHRVDRYGRGLRFMLNSIHEIESLGGLVLSATQAYDPTTSSGRFTRNLLGAMAEHDRDQIVARTYAGLRRVATQGFWPGGAPPFGLARSRDEASRHTVVVLDETEAACVREAARLVVDEGLDAHGAAARLNALGHRTRTGKAWNANALMRVLRSDHLSGAFVWGGDKRGKAKGEPIPIAVPAVLDPARHAEVRAAVGSPKPRGGRATYLLGRRLLAPCGTHYRGDSMSRDGGRRYACALRRSGCRCPRLDAEHVEARVWQAVTDLLSEPERLTAMAADYLALRGQQMGAERDQLGTVTAKITKLERALTETVVSYAREGLPAEAVRAATEALSAELDELRRHRDQLERWRVTNADTSATMRRLWELAETAQARMGTMTLDERVKLLALLDVKVTVTAVETCGECGGAAKVGGRRGGYRCPSCRGLRAHTALRVEGTVLATLADRLGPQNATGDFARTDRAVPWQPPNNQERVGGHRSSSSRTRPRPLQDGQVWLKDSTRSSATRLRVISTRPSSEIS